MHRGLALAVGADVINLVLELQKGKPDVIAEFPSIELERKLGPSVPARNPGGAPASPGVAGR